MFECEKVKKNTWTDKVTSLCFSISQDLSYPQNFSKKQFLSEKSPLNTMRWIFLYDTRRNQIFIPVEHLHYSQTLKRPKNFGKPIEDNFRHKVNSWTAKILKGTPEISFLVQKSLQEHWKSSLWFRNPVKDMKLSVKFKNVYKVLKIIFKKVYLPFSLKLDDCNQKHF